MSRKEISLFLFGDEKNFSFEQRLLLSALVLGIFLCIAGTITNVFLNASLIAIITPLLLLGVILNLYYRVRFKKLYASSATPTAVIGILGISITWVFNGGMDGSNIMPAFVILVLALIIVPDKNRVYIFGLFFGMNILILLIQLFLPEVIIGYPSERARWIDNLITFMYSAAFMYIIIRFIYKNYNEERSKVIESEKNFRIIFENNSAAIAIFEEDSTISNVNDEFCNISGYSKEEAIGMSREQLFLEEEFGRLQDCSQRRLKNPDYAANKYEFKFKNKAGETGYAIASVSILENKKSITSYMDITDRMRSELVIKNQNEVLKQFNEQKDKFISILSHDLKSPLSGVLSLSELLQENIHTYNTDEIEKKIRVINQSVNYTYNLLEDILSWARIQQNNIAFNPQNLNFNSVCKEIIETIEYYADIKNITVSCSVNEDLTAFADEDMFKTILRNLISNAIKFTHKGGTIAVMAEKNDSDIRFSVSDNGIGIKAEDLQQLFTCSRILSTIGTEDEKGSGLGLMLCKDFVEKHGGRIWVESEPETGSSFYFTIPLLQNNIQSQPLSQLNGKSYSG
jgi:two-component system, sensor histidine kinase and response regulator